MEIQGFTPDWKECPVVTTIRDRASASAPAGGCDKHQEQQPEPAK
jgi:hypothetical protein